MDISMADIKNINDLKSKLVELNLLDRPDHKLHTMLDILHKDPEDLNIDSPEDNDNGLNLQDNIDIMRLRFNIVDRSKHNKDNSKFSDNSSTLHISDKNNDKQLYKQYLKKDADNTDNTLLYKQYLKKDVDELYINQSVKEDIKKKFVHQRDSLDIYHKINYQISATDIDRAAVLDNKYKLLNINTELYHIILRNEVSYRDIHGTKTGSIDYIQMKNYTNELFEIIIKNEMIIKKVDEKLYGRSILFNKDEPLTYELGTDYQNQASSKFGYSSINQSYSSLLNPIPSSYNGITHPAYKSTTVYQPTQSNTPMSNLLAKYNYHGYVGPPPPPPPHLPPMRPIDLSYKYELGNFNLENDSFNRTSKDTPRSVDRKTSLQKVFDMLRYKIDKEYTEEEEEYFKGLSQEERTQIKDTEKEISLINKKDVPVRFHILSKEMCITNKANIINKLDEYAKSKFQAGDNIKFNNWINGIVKIPFGVHVNIPIKKEDGKEVILKYINNSKDLLDNAVYGHKETKMEILHLLGQWISNPTSCGNVIGIQGPMGNGKTTLVKDGISRAIKRPFEFISLGGCSDSSYLDGHSYTFEGSTWGRIVDVIIRTECMNPVFYFDELDKVSDTPKGEEIINLLIHLTDASQNTKFQDKYYSGINLDLSKALFIFSFNDISKVNPILLDRLIVIKTKGFDTDDKLQIVNKFLLPRIIKKLNIEESEFCINDDNIKYMIDTYTEEKGVRKLEQCIATIFSKLNILLLTEDLDLIDNLFDKYEKPFIITNNLIDKILKSDDNTDLNISTEMMYM